LLTVNFCNLLIIRVIPQETPEQKAAREKREKTQRMIAAITDGLVGISNIAGAMGGATPVKQTPISIAVGQNADKLRAVRDANRKQYEAARQYALKLQQAQDADQADKEAEAFKGRRDALAKSGGLFGIVAQRKAARQKAKDDADYKKGRAKAEDEYRAGQLALGRQRNALAAQRNAISAAKGSGSGGREGKYTIRLHDQSIHEYDSSRIGAITALAPVMKEKALAASKRYQDQADSIQARLGAKALKDPTYRQLSRKADHYEDIAKQLTDKANTKETMAAIVAANAWDFPSMDAKVREAINISAPVKTTTKKKVAGFGSPSKTKKKINGFGTK